jgi:ATP-dependent Clp protease adapter protein ClpS
MGTPKDEFNTKAWGLWITPQKEDLEGKQHINTRVESSSSKGCNNVTLIKFTAEVTMGSDLYAEWAKDGRFNMPSLADIGGDQKALPHTTKYLNPREEPVDVAGGKTNMPFAVFVLNDSVNSMECVQKMLEKTCALTAPEAMAAMLLVHNNGEGIVFEARTEDEALGVTSKLQQAGLKSEIRNRAQDLIED